MANTKQATIQDVYTEVRNANCLTILSLVRSGIQQKDIATALGISPATLSRMFPKGVLQRISKGSRGADLQEVEL